MTNALDVDKDGDAGDWRMSMVARVAEVSGHYRANDIVRHVVSVEEQPGLLLSFAVPSSVALALDIAEQAAQRASSLKLQISYKQVNVGGGAAFGVATDGLPTLYDFLEQSMIAAVFAYQAVESFANGVIGRELKGPMKVPRGRKLRELTPDKLARQLSTKEKLMWVLPKFKHVDSPEGSVKWKRFERLESARDSIVHLKVYDQFGKDRESLFFKMLDIRTTEFPSAAVMLIHHYFKADGEPRWLLKFLGLRDHS